MKKRISLLMIICMIVLLCHYSPKTYCVIKQTTLGQKWTKNTSIGSRNLYTVAYGNGTFVAIGNDGDIQFSKDGTLWEKANSKTSESLNQILWNGKNFIVLGSNSIFVSSNGSSWNKVYSDVSNMDDGEGIINLVWNKKIFITARGQTIITSKDGKKWTAKKLGSDIYAEKILWNGKTFILRASNLQSGDEYSELYFSTDGYNWSKKSFNNSTLGDMVYYKGSLYAVSYS